MTLLLIDGFDNADNVPKPGFVQGGNASANMTGRDGSTNGAFYTSSNSGGVSSSYALPSSAATLIMGQGLYMSNVAGGLWWHTGGNTTQQCSLALNVVTRRWEFRLGLSTVLATSAAAAVYTPATWVHVQVKLVLHATAGSFILRVNEVELLNYTGQTATTGGPCTGFTFYGNTGPPNGTGTGADDLWVCDAVDATASQGRPFNDFLGDCKIAALVPSAAGDDTTWTPSTGANWATLDENPVTSTDYVEKLGSASGSRDLYACSDLPVAATTVLAVQSKVYDTKTEVGSAQFKQVVKEAGGTISTIGTHAPSIGLAPHVSSVVTKRPSDGGLWTVANINGLQTGVEVV